MPSVMIETIKGNVCDRPPVWFMRQAGRVLPSYNKLREKYSFSELMLEPELAAKVTLLPVYDLEVDAAILFSDILVVPQALGMKVEFTNHGPVFEKPLKMFSNPLEAIYPDLGFFEYIYKTVQIIKDSKPDEVPLIGFCGAPLTVLCYMIQGLSFNHDFPDATRFILEEPVLTGKLTEIITETSIQYAKGQIMSGAELFQLFDTHAGLIPFELYKKLFLPAVKEIGEAVRAAGVPFIFFPKGIGNGISAITTDIADVVSVDWQNSLSLARKQVGTDMVLQGNFDPRIMLCDNKVILNELNDFYTFGSADSKWIFNLGHGVLPNTPVSNAKFVVDWVKTTDWKRNFEC